MRDVDRDDEAANILASINPNGGVPTFDVDGAIVRGFRAQRLEAVIRAQAEAR